MHTFNDLIGQEQIKEHLQKALSTNQLNHAYIISGEKGSGKEFIAKIFAAAINCTGEGEKPCCKCHSCMQASAGNHPDIKTIVKDKTTVISVDAIREQINQDAVIRPFGSGKKIYIIKDADNMNPQAQNALLKTIEEPPEYVVFMLLTAYPDRLLPTIHSRCVELTTKSVEPRLVRKFLLEQVGAEDYKVDVCIAFARGNVGKAKQLASSEEFENIKNESVNLLRNIKNMEVDEISDTVARLSELKLSVQDFFDILYIWYRDVLLYKATKDVSNLTFKDEIRDIIKQASESSYDGIETIIEAIDTASRRINAKVNFDLTMELLLLTIRDN